MIIKRTLTSGIQEKIQQGNKVVVIYGARQTGKTTLVRSPARSFSISKLLLKSGKE